MEKEKRTNKMLIIKGACLKCNNSDTQVIEFQPHEKVPLPTDNPKTMPGLCQICGGDVLCKYYVPEYQ